VKTLQSLSHKTQLCAVIGNPIEHTLSPAIHNAAFEALGLDFVYLAFKVEDVKGTLAGMRALDTFRGLSVTIPHKLEVMKYVDEIPEVDRSIGAINTVIHEGDKLLGFSTDGPGAMKALTDAGVDVSGKHVLILGAGGAARTLAFTLVKTTKIAGLSLLDIDEALLAKLSADLRQATAVTITAEKLSDVALKEAMKTSDIIIHCTSIGMYPKVDASLIPAELLRPEQVVFDIVYTPLETKLLKDAKARGCKVIPGIEMFINQAALQFERFTGIDAPLDVMRKVVMEKLTS